MLSLLYFSDVDVMNVSSTASLLGTDTMRNAWGKFQFPITVAGLDAAMYCTTYTPTVPSKVGVSNGV